MHFYYFNCILCYFLQKKIISVEGLVVDIGDRQAEINFGGKINFGRRPRGLEAS